MAKERSEMVKKKMGKGCGTRNEYYGSLSIGSCWMCVIRLTTCWSRRMCVSMCGTLLQWRGKGKEHENAREDLKDMGIRPELYEEETDSGTDLPVAATTLSKMERQ